jgi:serine protease Do
MNATTATRRFPLTTRTLTATGVALAILGVSATAITTGTRPANADPTPLVQAPAQTALPGIAEVADAVRPAVVSIRVSRAAAPDHVSMSPGDMRRHDFPFDGFMQRFFDEDEQKRFSRRFRQHGGNSPQMGGMGSGFIVDGEGYIVTNDHVVKTAEQITVTLDSGRSYEAELVARDPRTDLALLKIEPEDDLHHVRFGDSDDSRVGDWVVAVGNPFGLGHTVTTGIVSARGRNIGSGSYDDYLQIDAPINKGNSGGPVFNLRGEVIGVNTAIFSPNGGSVGIGFAIPASLVEEVVADLKDHGSVRRGWLGVQIQAVSQDMADSLALDSTGQAIVAKVEPGSPAAQAGIRQGDVILTVEDETIEKMRELPRTIAQIDSGKKVDITVWRDGREKTLQVTVARLPGEDTVATASDSAKGHPNASLGLALDDLDSATRRGYGIDKEVRGAVIAGVKPGSPAARKGLREGDVIVSVDREKVNAAGDVVEHVAQAKREDRKAVLFLVRNEKGPRFVALPLNKG